MCFQQAGDLGMLIAKFHSDSECLRINGIRSSPSLSAEAKKVPCPSLKTGRENKLSLTQPFCSVQASKDWIGPPTLERAI